MIEMWFSHRGKNRVELRIDGRCVKCPKCGASYGSSEKEGAE